MNTALSKDPRQDSAIEEASEFPSDEPGNQTFTRFGMADHQAIEIAFFGLMLSHAAASQPPGTGATHPGFMFVAYAAAEQERLMRRTTSHGSGTAT